MNVHIKSGARVFGIKPELLLALIVADGIWTERGKMLTVTSFTEGKYMPGNLHYKGPGVDFLSNDLGNQEQADLLTTLKSRLGSDWNVLLEGDHYHVEFDPKEPY